jgi:hypothetical protein
VALLLGALLAADLAHQRMDSSARIDQGERFLPRPQQARLSALGFDALVADYHWLQAIQIVGGEPEGVGKHESLIGRLIELVTTLDPWVGPAYRFAAVWLTDSEESVQRANALLERAIAYHPRDWRNRHYLGFNHFFYLGDNPRAADVLESAVGLPDAPAYLGTLVARLRMDRDGLETVATFLTELAAGTEDEYARAEYLKALDEVETERRARVLDAARGAYRRRAGRDIRRVEDLVRGPHRVLRRLPPAHPHFRDFDWTLDPESGEIVSSFYGSRYAPHAHRLDRERRERWRREAVAGEEAGS